MFKMSMGLWLLLISTLSSYGLASKQVNITQDVESCDALEQLIAYTVRSENGLDIWTVKPSDFVATNLTKGNSHNLNPSWSPDGSKLIFKTYRDGNWEIYLMDTNGSNLTNLSNDASDDEYPKWSPDGTKIAFISNRGGNQDIYVMDSDGTHIVNISNDSGDSIMPVWSPTGEAIAYLSGDNNIRQIVVRDLKEETTVSYPNTKNVNFMSWSPSGDFMTFSSEMDGNSEIYLLDIKRQLIAKLTTSTVDINLQPYWSPSSNLILYWANKGNVAGTSVYVISADGNIDRKLAPISPNDSGGIWSPDGNYIAFYSGQGQLYMMDSDGNNARKLASPIEASSLTWQPCLMAN